MLYSLYCNECDEEYEEESCRVFDILETATARKFCFICLQCDQERCSELSEI